MRHLDLFSGIGGFSLAASWVWGNEHEIVGFCEIDNFCQKVLNKHWPGVPIYSDIKELKGNQFNAVDLITGGDPCQPHSLSGKRKGTEDDRYLWPEMFKVIQSTRPDWIINENVAGSVSNGIVDTKCDDLERAGYACQAYNIPAIGVGAPHFRHRIWIVAHSIGVKNNAKHIQSLRHCKQKRRDIEIRGKTARQANGETSADRAIRHGAFMADANGSSFGKLRRASSKTEKFKATPVKPFLFPDGISTEWQSEPGLGRMANGVSDKVDRLRSLGNAIVPQVAAVIMQGIKEVESAF